MSLILERISEADYQSKKTNNTLDNSTIYFIHDKGTLYTHNELYSGKYEFVDELPDSPELNTLYILNDTLEIKIYDGTEYRVVAKGYSSIIDENSDDSTVPTSKAVYELVANSSSISGDTNVQSDWNEEDSTSDSYIKNKPEALPANGGNADTVNGHTVASDVPADAVFTDTIYEPTVATTEELGEVIVGNGLEITEEGVLSVSQSFFVSVSNGKSEIASAITAKGVDTEKDATFSQMADNILAIEGGAIEGGGWVSMEDDSSYKYLLEHYYLPYLQKTYDVKSYILSMHRNYHIIIWQGDGAKLKVKWGKRKNFELDMLADGASCDLFPNIDSNGYINIFSRSSYDAIHYTIGSGQMMFYNITCEVPKIQNRLNKWSRFDDITWFDVIKFPNQCSINNIDYDVKDYLCITNSAGTYMRLYAFPAKVTLTITDDGFLRSENMVCRYSYVIDDTESSYNPGVAVLDTLDSVNIDYSSSTVDEIVGFIQCSTFDILDSAGNVLYAADCTLEQLTTYEE